MTPCSVMSSASTVARTQADEDDVSEYQGLKEWAFPTQYSQKTMSCRVMFRVWMLLVRRKRSCQDRVAFVESKRLNLIKESCFHQWLNLHEIKTRGVNMMSKAVRIHRLKLMKKTLSRIVATLALDKQSVSLLEDEEKHSKEIQRLQSLVSRHLKLARSQEELIQTLQHRIENSDKEFLLFMREKNQEILHLQSKSCADTRSIRNLQKKVLEESMKNRSFSPLEAISEDIKAGASKSHEAKRERNRLHQEQCEIDLASSRERLERLLSRR
ncbi:hypothetical protein GUITHDRAFT_99377 [Guillardia theta CCMP2712]|uniref:Uncharacterized protein n=1 Tax=Guillardia theta (strain CCMP2712) TaxID=905079 RepID=L1K1K2_GUITC|nr:hypothetical protein GUITHDRAFT_99377 [Guillardia theta CCMP2712]EKX54721.1 hypothetical protein GUITHDRAFT_99377 [Guillardia theta CCMP2712]|eukprot:XP_005841701.1 hypothetical protein GUITHDRAFT_99377 [Guillardia theta CCMP2712]